MAHPAPFGQLLELSGHRVHYHCEGRGSQTVVLLHGTPRFSFHFALIQPGIAKFARVCTYDRAGDAWSEAVPNQPQAQQLVDELDEVVTKLSPRKSVVLAGHSIGGVLARAYFAQHPDRVSAMVLIDSAPLDGAPATDEQLHAQADAERARAPGKRVAQKLRPPFTLLPARFHAAHLWATDKWYAYAAGVDPYVALKYEAELYALARAGQSQTLPVWIISRARTMTAEEPWITRQLKLASSWRNSRLLRAVGSGHDVQIERPTVVINAVRSAVELIAGADRR
jgi:pimeloyl-ACP methyl ester carboxylesterase